MPTGKRIHPIPQHQQFSYQHQIDSRTGVPAVNREHFRGISSTSEGTSLSPQGNRCHQQKKVCIPGFLKPISVMNLPNRKNTNCTSRSVRTEFNLPLHQDAQPPYLSSSTHNQFVTLLLNTTTFSLFPYAHSLYLSSSTHWSNKVLIRRNRSLTGSSCKQLYTAYSSIALIFTAVLCTYAVENCLF